MILRKCKVGLAMLIAGMLLIPGFVAAAEVKIDGARADYLFAQQILFIDVRSNGDWDAGRIAGAEHLDVSSISEEKLAGLVDKDFVFIIYGNDASDKRGSDAVAKAVSWGYTKVHFYPDGFIDWKKRGKPVE